MQTPETLAAPDATLAAHADCPLVAALLEPGGLRRRWLLPPPEDDDDGEGGGEDGCGGSSSGSGGSGGGYGGGGVPLPSSLSADALREAAAVSADLRVRGVPCGLATDGYGTAMRAAFLVRSGRGTESCEGGGGSWTARGGGWRALPGRITFLPGATCSPPRDGSLTDIPLIPCSPLL